MRLSAALALLLTATTAPAAERRVTTVAQLQAALAAAQAGDTVVLADGTYDVGTNLTCAAEGTAALPIVVRAEHRHAARVRFTALEGFKVTGRHWRFEGLDVEGVCAQDAACEHAFHVTGHAEGFVLRDSRVRNFNAQLKVNASQGAGGAWEIPHRGLVERNELYDTRPRVTSSPVTKLNIDTGDDWVVRDNYLHDFARQGGIAYGAFMKSGGSRGVFERNLVVCTKDGPAGDTRIGLSFGGGGTGNAFCAPSFDAGVTCDPEHADGTLRNNVIANCSDVGIYLNRAARTQVLFNTLVGTTGVDFRYPSSSGEAHGNVLSSVIRTRDGASVAAGTNRTGVTESTWAGWYRAPLAGDLHVVGDVSTLIGTAAARASVTGDYCGRARPTGGAYTLGALEHSLGDCSPDGGTGDAGVAADAGSAADAGAGTDAGAPGGGGVDVPDDGPEGGCSCGAAPGLAAVLALLLLPLARRLSEAR